VPGGRLTCGPDHAHHADAAHDARRAALHDGRHPDLFGTLRQRPDHDADHSDDAHRHTAWSPGPVVTVERAPYVQTRVGEILGSGFWRVSMAFPGEAHETAFTIPSWETRRWMLDGDNGWQQGDLIVSVNGQLVDRGQAVFGPGSWRIRAEAVDNPHTREHGVGATAIQLFRIQ
jgi:hypothetical protein